MNINKQSAWKNFSLDKFVIIIIYVCFFHKRCVDFLRKMIEQDLYVIYSENQVGFGTYINAIGAILHNHLKVCNFWDR